MTSEERLLKTLQREPVDRVPTFEWLIDQKVRDAILPGATEAEFAYRMDLDALCVDLNYASVEIEPQIYRDEWGMVKKNTGQAHTFPLRGPIKTLQDLEKYVPPDPHKPERYKTLERMLAEHAGKKAVILHLNDVFSIPSRLMVFDDFLVSTAEAPQLIEGLVALSVEVNLQLAQEAVKRGVKIIYTGDDYAYNSGPMISPRQFRKLFYPGLQKVMQGYKALGLYVIKHTDGNIRSLLDMIVDAGIDCLDPIDPVAGMDLAEMKQKYGQRIALKGNVDCAQTLTFGSVAETIAETKNCLRVAAPGGGYILSSSNSIHSAVKPENYLAMLDTLKQYGAYPIQA
jgi:uroporphyrinogen decarboxylase